MNVTYTYVRINEVYMKVCMYGYMYYICTYICMWYICEFMSECISENNISNDLRDKNIVTIRISLVYQLSTMSYTAQRRVIQATKSFPSPLTTTKTTNTL